MVNIMDILSDVDLNKGQKLIRILQRLQRPEGARASELLRDFGLNERSLRRYMTDLREIGVPVNKKSVPVLVGLDVDKNTELMFTVDAGFQREGIQITLLEWISLRFGRNMFTFLEGTNFSEDFDEALDKLSCINIGNNQNLTRDMDKKFLNIAEHTKDHTDQSEIIDDIITCLLHQNPAQTFYARIGSRIKTYTLHPYTLVTFRQGLYLFAWDVEAKQIKTFAVERFHKFNRDRKNHFNIPIDYKPQDIIKDSFGIIKGSALSTVKLRFSKRAAPYIQERTWHHSQILEPASQSEIILTLNVGIAYELKQWVLGFGSDVTVLEPASLANDIVQSHREALGNYSTKD
jgi:predicted DNA-binding transcriptional regulator YafY